MKRCRYCGFSENENSASTCLMCGRGDFDPPESDEAPRDGGDGGLATWFAAITGRRVLLAGAIAGLALGAYWGRVWFSNVAWEGAAPSAADVFAREKFGVVKLTTQTALGSGFVIEGRDVVTNWHVVDDAKDGMVTVEFADGTSTPGRVTKTDKKNDLAVVRPETWPEKHHVLQFSGASPKVGETVYVVGHPKGKEWSFTSGVVSKLPSPGASDSTRFIQTDASVNSGNSGGPLLDVRGRVCGVIVAVERDAQGMGYAIPLPLVRDLIAQ